MLLEVIKLLFFREKNVCFDIVAPLQTFMHNARPLRKSLVAYMTKRHQNSIVSWKYPAMENGMLPKVSETTNTSQPCQYLFRQWNVLRVKNGILYREWYPPRGQHWLQLIVPHSMRQMILKAAHQPVGNAHIMRNKMLECLRQRYWWPMMSQDVCISLSTCRGCQSISHPQKKREPMQVCNIGSPFSSISIDWTGLDHSQ